MIKCPNCQAEYPENTLFCEECGHYLLRGEQLETNTLVFDGVDWKEREETRESPAEEVTPPLYLRLTIPDSGREVEMPLTKKRVSIGRLDPASANFPEVDLTAYGAAEKGVSRRHAQITRQGDDVFIEDLGSINGTFLNRKRLTSYCPQILKSGDELQLGNLVLRVSFK